MAIKLGFGCYISFSTSLVLQGSTASECEVFLFLTFAVDGRDEG